MKQTLIGLLSGILILAACAQRETISPVTTTQEPTTTPSLAPTGTSTPIPTATPTASITPLPTIPTFTPTFDVRAIVTVTPASKAKCPETIPYSDTAVDLFKLMMKSKAETVEEVILSYLDAYDPEPMVEYAQNAWGTAKEHSAFQDFTNDSLPELAMGTSTGITAFHIFGCQDGHYKELLHIPSNGLSGPATFISIGDHNLNGLVELTLLTGFLSQGGHFYQVYEWNGTEFASILPAYRPDSPNTTYLWAEATGEIHYEDVDKDGLQELILDSGIPVWETYYSGLPWRNERTYYKWNGQSFVPNKREFASPEFRFQAVQDADLAMSQNEYENALGLYEEAISSKQLKSYSPEIRKNLQANWDSQLGQNPPPSLTPYPVDITEYPRLAAYAYYRVMLLHFSQGNEMEANSAYERLHLELRNNVYAQPYIEMANVFWDAYQSTHKMYDGCAAAIQYAAEHPEILIPLGSDYHGWQSHTYVPADVCPFR